jgi:hypothetical protein
MASPYRKNPRNTERPVNTTNEMENARIRRRLVTIHWEGFGATRYWNEK